MDIQELARAIEARDTAMAAKMEAVKTSATETEKKVGGIEAEILELHQKMARRGGNGEGSDSPLSWGQQFVKGVNLKGFQEGVARRKQSEAVLIKTTVTTAQNSAGALTDFYRDDGVALPTRPLKIRDLLPKVRITTGAVLYAKQTARSSAAATVAEGALKPESAMAFEMKTVAAKVIAHWIPASNQILDDLPQLAGMIDTDLRYGLALKEDSQIIAGDGQGENLLGLIPQASAYAAPFTVTNATIIDQVGLAILQAALTDFPPDGIVMHPTDWMRIRLTKDAGGNYIFGNPATSNTASLWGLPVVATTSISVDKFLVGSFQAAATIYDRWEPRVEISTEHADFFVRNLVAIRAEERLALAVRNPNALIYGDFGFVA